MQAAHLAGATRRCWSVRGVCMCVREERCVVLFVAGLKKERIDFMKIRV
jgi:hypothetical protein